MFKYDLLDLNKDTEIVNAGEKTIYNTDEIYPASDWVREEVKGLKTFDYPLLSSPTTVKQSGRGKSVKNALGYFYNDSNSVMKNTTSVSIFTSSFSGANGLSINLGNFHKVTTLFTARKLTKGDWVNWYDEYLAPNEEHEQFKQFKNDSLIYSLFESKSNQSSLRQITYKDKLWDIKNEFFWMSKNRMKELADENGYDNLYNDARTSSDRHVYNLLFGEERIYDKLSDDAKVVLDKATELVEKSMKMRQVMADDHNHLDSWDAGYAQLKLVWKEYFEEDFKEFRQLYKNLEDRMRPLVYELEFLMK
jgi:hypothetical protein